VLLTSDPPTIRLVLANPARIKFLDVFWCPLNRPIGRTSSVLLVVRNVFGVLVPSVCPITDWSCLWSCLEAMSLCYSLRQTSLPPDGNL
jgi:hypothetical protein